MLGVSSNTIAVGWRSAARHSSILVPSTNTGSIPYCGSSVLTIQWQEPNSARAATTRSPVFSVLSIAPCTAAIPVAVQRHASAPSISASRPSSICKREYW